MLATDYFVDGSCFCVKGCFLNFIVRDKYRYFNSPILNRLNPFNDEYLHSVMNSPNSNYESIIFKREKRLALRQSLFLKKYKKQEAIVAFLLFYTQMVAKYYFIASNHHKLYCRQKYDVTYGP